MPTGALLTATGHFIRAAQGGDDVGELRADRTALGPDETFTRIPLGGDWVALQTRTGRFWSAQGGGGGALVANRAAATSPDPTIPAHLRTAIGGWERFRWRDGGLETENGHFVCAEDGGGGALVANRTARGPWETFRWIPAPASPGVPPPGAARAGVPRGNTFQVVDDTGGWLALGTTLFWGAYGCIAEKDRLTAHLQWTQGKGIDHVRVIATGLRKGTLERSLSPKSPNFQKGIAGATQLAAAYGQRVSWTIFGATYDAPSATDREKAVDAFCEALQGLEQHVFLVEIANEGDINGFAGESGRAELKRLVARVARKLPNLVAPTCPERGDDISPALIRPLYENTAATIQTHHYSRRIGPPDGIWRPTKKAWRETTFSVPRCCKAVTAQEGRGPESSGSETNDPLVLTMDAVHAWLSGVGAYVLHCGAGIYGVPDPRGPGPEDNRPANLWETVNIDAILDGIQTARRLLAPDLPNWTKHRTNEGPFGFVDTPQEQLSFAYSATTGIGAGQRIVMPVVGVSRTTVFTLRGGRCTGQVVHPVSGTVLESFDQACTVSPATPAVLVLATRV